MNLQKFPQLKVGDIIYDRFGEWSIVKNIENPDRIVIFGILTTKDREHMLHRNLVITEYDIVKITKKKGDFLIDVL